MSKVVASECRVALLSGGTSGEREISLKSGEGAKEALEEAGFPVTCLDPASHDDLVRLFGGEFDVVFICLHGKLGEDGAIQGLLEHAGLPYTGSGVLASAVAMDKSVAKVLYRDAGLPTPPAAVFYRTDGQAVGEALSKVGLPCVVKPASEGSALGVVIVENESDLEPAIEEARTRDESVLVERYVDGTEVTVAVLGNDDPQALPIIEIIPMNEFYDFDSKYAQGGSQHICPARLDEETTRRIQQLAVEAHRVLGCRGMSRTDFIVDKTGEPWILETNTIPGMTGTSLLPDAARVAGMSFPELCTKLIEFALE